MSPGCPIITLRSSRRVEGKRKNTRAFMGLVAGRRGRVCLYETISSSSDYSFRLRMRNTHVVRVHDGKKIARRAVGKDTWRLSVRLVSMPSGCEEFAKAADYYFARDRLKGENI